MSALMNKTMRLNLMIALLKGLECRFFTVLFITLANPKAEQDLVGMGKFVE